MLLHQLWQSVEAHLRTWRRRWWPADPLADQGTEGDRLAAEIAAAEAELNRSSAAREELRERVTTAERRALRLTAQVSECLRSGYEEQAWPFALELDEVNRSLTADRHALERCEQLCWSQEFRLRQLERQLARVEKQRERTRVRQR